MKKVLLSVAVVAAFGLASCGGPDVCECVNMEEPSEECKDLEKEWKKEFEEASDEEKEEMMKEFEDCQEDEEEGDEE